MGAFTIKEVDRSEIVVGDTIIMDGVMKTVCNNNIKYNEFFGITIHGCNFRLGMDKVQKVLFDTKIQKQ